MPTSHIASEAASFMPSPTIQTLFLPTAILPYNFFNFRSSAVLPCGFCSALTLSDSIPTAVYTLC